MLQALGFSMSMGMGMLRGDQSVVTEQVSFILNGLFALTLCQGLVITRCGDNGGVFARGEEAWAPVGAG
jgi:hypothetical protein